MADAEIGVFGGSGFYAFLEAVDEVELETPYGKPSGPLVLGELDGRRVAFLPRHGPGALGGEPVSHETVVEVFQRNNDRLRELLFAVIPKIGPQPDDVCASALRGARI